MNDKTKVVKHTTNYIDTFIEVAEDSKTQEGTRPKASQTNLKKSKSIAETQFELIASNPYQYTSDDVLFMTYALRNNLNEDTYEGARDEFFSKGQPCLRTSPLCKSHGFGIHCDRNGKIALYGRESEEYQKFVSDPSVKKIKAMRSSKA